jgi:hypothetical protein
MDCQERLAEQAAQLKAANPDSNVWVYRNIVKALPWFSDVRKKINDLSALPPARPQPAVHPARHR